MRTEDPTVSGNPKYGKEKVSRGTAEEGSLREQDRGPVFRPHIDPEDWDRMSEVDDPENQPWPDIDEEAEWAARLVKAAPSSRRERRQDKKDGPRDTKGKKSGAAGKRGRK